MDGAPTDLPTRQQAALTRIEELIVQTEARAHLASRRYAIAQVLGIGLAAITPCLILLGDSGFPRWLQSFPPAIAAIAMGLGHIFHWREDGARFSVAAETFRSELWRYQTRTGAYGPTLTDEQALDHLVTQVDEEHLRTAAQWAADRLATPDEKAGAPETAKAPAAPAAPES
mgnify:CR=1 FL=1